MYLYCDDDDIGGGEVLFLFFFLFDLGIQEDLGKVPVFEVGAVIL